MGGFLSYVFFDGWVHERCVRRWIMARYRLYHRWAFTGRDCRKGGDMSAISTRKGIGQRICWLVGIERRIRTSRLA
jgi:hypothetical protein